MKPKYKTLILFGFALFVVSPRSAFAEDAATTTTHGISVTNIDASIVPGNDFYSYANGAWLTRTTIPPDRAEVGVWTVLSDLADKRVAGLIEEAAKSKAPAGSGERKIADLYNSFMNEAAIEALGLKPLASHLGAIAAIKSKRELARALGQTLRADVDALNNTNYHTPNLFGLWVAPGFNDSDHYAAYLMQGGLELPDREYYLSDSAEMQEVRKSYQAHVAAVLKLAGFTDPQARAARIFQLEHSIAEKHISLADDQDIHKANNTWSRSDFSQKAPGLDWAEYFRG